MYICMYICIYFSDLFSNIHSRRENAALWASIAGYSIDILPDSTWNHSLKLSRIDLKFVSLAEIKEEQFSQFIMNVPFIIANSVDDAAVFSEGLTEPEEAQQLHKQIEDLRFEVR